MTVRSAALNLPAKAIRLAASHHEMSLSGKHPPKRLASPAAVKAGLMDSAPEVRAWPGAVRTLIWVGSAALAWAPIIYLISKL